jgi:hypothetical protein
VTLTEKQKAWDATKAATRAEDRRRGVRTPLMPSHRPRRHCTVCPHSWKGHKLRGRCKNGCKCTAGKERARGR